MSNRAALQATPGYNPRRRPRLWLVLLLIVGHLAVGLLLVRLLAPDFTAGVIDRATSTMTVFVTTPPEPEPEPTSEPEPVMNEAPEEGESAPEAEEAVAREVVAPEPAVPLPRPSPAPRASSTGNANTSGAGDEGDGTGAGGEGNGTGSGRSGDGQGGLPVTRPSVRSGRIDSARDFPIPDGGRRVRDGTSVIVSFIVGVDGRASNCSVTQPGPDARTNALVCPLVIERIIFNPARDSEGNAVPARYGWRQDFYRR